MTSKRLLIAMILIAALFISTAAYAGNGMGSGMGDGQGMMGGQGHGMMGGRGNGMMDSAPNDSTHWPSPQSEKSAMDLEKRIERKQLREEIRKKRQELSELYNSDKPDKAQIDQKISELHALEADYDRSLFSTE